MWQLPLALLLASACGQLTDDSNTSTRTPWNRYEPSDPQNPSYGYRSPFDRQDQNTYDHQDPNTYDRQDQSPTFPGSRTPSISDPVIFKEATYFVVASRMCRPGQIYRVAVDVLRSTLPITVRATIQRNGVEIAADHKEVKEGIPEYLMLRMPPTSIPGDYKLRVEGLYNGLTGGQAFLNETHLTFTQRAMTIFIQLDKPVYMQGQTVRFRAIPINTELKAFNDPVDVYMRDPHGRIMRRWLSRQSNLGTVSLSYQLSDQPVFGNWVIQIRAQGQEEETTFVVEEYYQTRFEVNVTMPAFFFNTDPYIHGIIQANYTSGAPVRGNLTLKASYKPIDKYRAQITTSHDQYFNFNEHYPAWFKTVDNYGSSSVLRFFNGTYRFQYPMADLLAYSPSLDGMEVTMTATVGERFLDEIIVGYSTARIYNSSVRVHFFGGSPQIFKPAMAFDLNLLASFHDGSILRNSQLRNAQMEVKADIETKLGRKQLAPQLLKATAENPSIWHVKIDLRKQLNLLDDPRRAQQELNAITKMTVFASLIDGEGYRANAELLLLAHDSPDQKHIKVTTSTKSAKVGEYLVLHVQTNFYIETFSYVILSKGTIILSGQDIMEHNIRTFSIPLSSEMAPVVTAVVYHVGRYGDVVADSLTIPVNGISRNNFTIFINNKKARTGESVEVAVYGEPGAYVALSGIDRAFYSMQAGNELTYANVIAKMAYYGEETNGTHSHAWVFHDGDPDEVVHFPSSTFGIDVNRTFEFIGLIVFTDAHIYRKPDHCNRTLGFSECLTDNRCYRHDQRCNGVYDCHDGTDEARCVIGNATDLSHFRKNRFNRIQRQYENVWLWKDINIGPHGRHIFNIDVPRRPVHWMVTAFSMSPTKGFGMLPKALEYTGVLPFFINVEMPERSRQGEQIGVRVSVFNYMKYNIEATVVLSGSKDYKFVHVEENGIVQSYKPRTSFGDHQFFIWIPAQDASIVYLPIVPVRLGKIKVKIYATTIIGRDIVEKVLHVEADGLPQYRHESILLDLSTKSYVFKYMHVNITEKPLIPYSEQRYYVYGSNKATISIVGDVVGAIYPTMPVNATSLLGLPMESAEQNMFSFAANVYTTKHMRLLDIERDRALEKESFYHMNILYQRQLSFMNLDGSFSLFRSDWNNSSPSVWLTAFCARVFQDAAFYEWENFLYIDPDVIAQAISWVLHHQTEYGSFYEITWFPDRKINSTLQDNDGIIKNRNISLTAHVLITLATAKDLTGGLGSLVALRAAKAAKWLEQNLNLLAVNGSSYEIAITAYALSLAQSSSAEQAFRLLEDHVKRDRDGLMYWGREPVDFINSKIENNKPFLLPRLPAKYDSENIETTAYALLVYVARQEATIEPIVKWLNTQRLTDGGWASTQDTVWAMKALMDYTVPSRMREVSDLTIIVEATSLPGQAKTLKIKKKNLMKRQAIEIPEAWGTATVQAKGAGYAILQMTAQYNVDQKRFQTDPPVKAFDLVVRPDFAGRNKSHIVYTSCQRWTNINESARSGMAVLDVTIPTGYMIQQQTLDRYTRSRQVRNLQRARFQWSEKKVLFYFDYLDNEETCVNFTVERWFPVANMSMFLPVRVYDYYAPERFNETMFDALPTYLLNICEVCGSSQCPYCLIYNTGSFVKSSGFILLISVLASTVRYFKTLEFNVG